MKYKYRYHWIGSYFINESLVAWTYPRHFSKEVFHQETPPPPGCPLKRVESVWKTGLFKSHSLRVFLSILPLARQYAGLFVCWSIRLSVGRAIPLWVEWLKNGRVDGVIRSSVHSFPRTAHSFSCSALLSLLACSAALIRSLAHSLTP